MSLRTLTVGVALATATIVSATTIAEALPINGALGVQSAPAPAVATENVRYVCGLYGCFWRPGWGYGYGYRRGWGWRGYGWRGGYGGWRGGYRGGWRGGYRGGWRGGRRWR